MGGGYRQRVHAATAADRQAAQGGSGTTTTTTTRSDARRAHGWVGGWGWCMVHGSGLADDAFYGRDSWGL